jgi:hypothetical protein
MKTPRFKLNNLDKVALATITILFCANVTLESKYLTKNVDEAIASSVRVFASPIAIIFSMSVGHLD